jgi:uncharacterized membrane protein HdeD (DUF308 family)
MLATILSRFWWMTLLRGVIAILFGIMLFAWPQISLASLVLVFGAFAFVDGVTNLVTALGGRKEHESWWVLLLTGLAGIGIGVLTFLNPGVTALALLFYIAIWAIAIGLLEIVAAIRLRQEIKGEFWLGLAGVASVAFGVLIAGRPGEGALAVLWLIGTYAIAYGAILVILAFQARSFVKRLKKAVAPA